MKKLTYLYLLCFVLSVNLYAQADIQYDISFKNAIHHEADVSIDFQNVDMDVLSVRMSRSSPGRYAIHEFAKNIYKFKAVDEKGNVLKVTRPNPYQWDIAGHQGRVKISYTLFANHADGTYSQIDETHAHLNIPATFMYAPALKSQPIHILLHPREDLNWRVATQLHQLESNEYFAPNLDYFMDSPIEISDHQIRSFKINSEGKDYDIDFVLHQTDGYDHFDAYFDKVKKIVVAEKNVFGSLPAFDFGSYTFLACYMPHVDGDGMEHRNSTILTSKRSLSKGGLAGNIGTVAHEFFHAWNVERIRPSSLEPFDYTGANMSGELWFAEGFTSYYTRLILCRTGIITREAYALGLSKTLNYVWNSPGRDYFNPVEMSYQAPFVDAATSVDQVNWDNTFISYYSYGNALGLALDLSLRQLKENKTLDGFMRFMWQRYGETEIPYGLSNLQNALGAYANAAFSQQFFDAYIYNSAKPDYKTLLGSVGIAYDPEFENKASYGATIKNVDNKWLVASYPLKASSLYQAGLSKGDRIVSIDGKLTNNKLTTDTLLNAYQAGDEVKVVFNRFDKQHEVKMIFTRDPSIKTSLMTDMSNEVLQQQELWLGDLAK